MNRLNIKDRAKILGFLVETPAMQAGVTDHIWTLEEIAQLSN